MKDMIAIGEYIKETKYLTFVVIEHKPKTVVVGVYTVNGLDLIAEIKWYSAWRQYTFDPEYNTTWNTQCLKDVAEVLEYLNTEQRKK